MIVVDQLVTAFIVIIYANMRGHWQQDLRYWIKTIVLIALAHLRTVGEEHLQQAILPAVIKAPRKADCALLGLQLQLARFNVVQVIRSDLWPKLCTPFSATERTAIESLHGTRKSPAPAKIGEHIRHCRG